MLNVTYAEFHKSALCAECRYAECRYAECRGADTDTSGLGINYSCKKFSLYFCFPQTILRSINTRQLFTVVIYDGIKL
jgi:hypothetical protein